MLVSTLNLVDLAGSESVRHTGELAVNSTRRETKSTKGARCDERKFVRCACTMFDFYGEDRKEICTV